MVGDSVRRHGAATRSRRPTAGVALLFMIAAAVLAGFGVAPMGILGGVLAWGAASLLWVDLAPAQRRQCAGLIGAGLAALAWAASSGAMIAPLRVLNENLPLVAMIAATNFIRLTSGGAQRAPAPRAPGPRALLSTLAGLNVLGAAINMTALVVFADRVADKSKLGLLEASWLARAFSMSVLYSPFIGGMAFALNLAPQASLVRAASVGIVLAGIGIGYTWLRALRTDTARVARFHGFPFQRDALTLPCLLAVAVLVTRWWLDTVPVLALIALLAPLCVLAVLIARVGFETTATRCIDHVRNELPRMSGELWLFLAAGVLAVGVSSALSAASFALPFGQVSGAVASIGLLAVTVLGAAGLHPVISLSALIPMLLPLDPSPNLIVTLCVCGWSLGCALCPYAGLNLILQGRFEINGRQLVRRSYGYAAFMWLACSAAMWLMAGGA